MRRDVSADRDRVTALRTSGIAGLLALATVAAPGPAAATAPGVPRIGGALRTRLAAIYRDGLARGNRPGVFAKVGDSITESGSFLQDVGCGSARLGAYRSLAPTVRFFSRTRLPSSYASAWCGVANSFTRASLTAAAGWDAGQALGRLERPSAACPAPFDQPLRCELRLLRPSVALVMYGTNDLERTGTGRFRTRLRAIVHAALGAGTIPVVSTIPARRDSRVFAHRVAAFNAAIAGVARAERVPVWDLHAALGAPGTIDEGISHDGIHLSVFAGGEAATFSPAALQFGYNRRNLTALEVLAELRRTALR
jgi:hypothetical protein